MNATRFELDDDRHLTIYIAERIFWEGSPEAFASDGDVSVPPRMLVEIETAVEDHDAAEEAREARGERSRD